MIHSEGMSRVNISKVAAEAGVTRQTIYNYFPDVESILARVIEDHAVAMEHELVDAMRRESSPLEQLSAVAEHRIVNAAHEHSGLDLEPGLSAEVRQRIETHQATVSAALERTVSEGIESGEFDESLVPAVTADLLLGIADGAAQAAMRHPDQKPFLLAVTMDAMRAVVAPAGQLDQQYDEENRR